MKDETQTADRRRHERRPFKDDQAGISFTVRAGDNTFDLLAAHDVSISGIRITVEQAMAEGQSVTLVAIMDDLQVDLNGEVRWCRPADDEGYELGVEFDNSDPDTNILFFMSLRKFLDGFDDEPVREL